MSGDEAAANPFNPFADAEERQVIFAVLDSFRYVSMSSSILSNSIQSTQLCGPTSRLAI